MGVTFILSAGADVCRARSHLLGGFGFSPFEPLQIKLTMAKIRVGGRYASRQTTYPE